MKEIDLTNKIPTTMTMVVNAVHNDEKRCWEITVQEMGTARAAQTQKAKENESLYYQRETELEIYDECDEYVIPIAILEHNGINTTKIRFTYVE